jgi:predicted lipoprotein with Yx(FWY)xxD motif
MTVRAVRRAALPPVAILAAALLAGCGSGAATAEERDEALPQLPAEEVTVQLVTVPGLGQVLADEEGYVLYMFPPDAARRVSCTGPCAGSWPPLAIEDGATPAAGDGVAPELLGTLPDPNTGGQVVTYGEHPLYLYAGDVDPGTANGQALFLNGGPWYVLDADGRPLTIDLRAAR